MASASSENWYEILTEVSLAAGGGALITAIGADTVANRLLGLPLWPWAWSTDERIGIAAAALAGAALLAWLTWITRRDSADKLRRGVQIDRD